jgi:hypothetical protein
MLAPRVDSRPALAGSQTYGVIAMYFFKAQANTLQIIEAVGCIYKAKTGW